MLYEVAITKTITGQNKRKGVIRERIVLNPVFVTAKNEDAAVLKATGGVAPDAGDSD